MKSFLMWLALISPALAQSDKGPLDPGVAVDASRLPTHGLHGLIVGTATITSITAHCPMDYQLVLVAPGSPMCARDIIPAQR